MMTPEEYRETPIDPERESLDNAEPDICPPPAHNWERREVLQDHAAVRQETPVYAFVCRRCGETGYPA
jgi:hypothetical protein